MFSTTAWEPRRANVLHENYVYAVKSLLKYTMSIYICVSVCCIFYIYRLIDLLFAWPHQRQLSSIKLKSPPSESPSSARAWKTATIYFIFIYAVATYIVAQCKFVHIYYYISSKWLIRLLKSHRVLTTNVCLGGSHYFLLTRTSIKISRNNKMQTYISNEYIKML